MTNWHQEVIDNEEQYLVEDANSELDEILSAQDVAALRDVLPDDCADAQDALAALEPAPRKTYNELVYCEDCRALVGKSDECLCLVASTPSWQQVVSRIQEVRGVRASEPSGGCGRTDGRTCCGGSC